MRRIAGFLLAPAGLLAFTAGVAIAASSPTVSTGGAKSVSNTAEALSGTVNPNGNQTGYVFQYGITNAYGLDSASHSAGGGTKPVKAAAVIHNLTPGTVYHYRLAALSRAGGANGADRTFKTSGAPPAGAATGTAVNIGKEQATPTGSITPNGANTIWAVQYGLTTAYGVQTFPQSIGAGNTPVPVSITLKGLAPATLFHYRVVAFHGGIASAGRGCDVLHRAHHPAQAPAERAHQAIGGPEGALRVHHHRSTARRDLHPRVVALHRQRHPALLQGPPPGRGCGRPSGLQLSVHGPGQLPSPPHRARSGPAADHDPLQWQRLSGSGQSDQPRNRRLIAF